MDNYKGPIRSIEHASLNAEVQDALNVWKAASKNLDWVLIGGIALSFYRAPRFTQDIDVLLLSSSKVPYAPDGFKKIRPHAFRENGTHVEIEFVTPELVNIPHSLVQQVFATAVVHDGIKVASAEGMIALKLYASENLEREYSDLGDVISILKNVPKVDMNPWHLPLPYQVKFFECQKRAGLNPHSK